MEFTGYRVVVTGAGRGLGRALALSLSRDGAEVFLSARSFKAAEDVAQEVRHVGGRAHAFECELADPESVRDFAAAVAHPVAAHLVVGGPDRRLSRPVVRSA